MPKPRPDRPLGPPIATHELTLRVRYAETDQGGVVHHSNYFVYFEMGRTEMLRSAGVDYRAIEERGFYLVIVKAECAYRAPTRYDDVVTLETHLQRVTPVRIEHRYRLLRDGALLAEGGTTLACVDASGEIKPLPTELYPGPFGTGR